MDPLPKKEPSHVPEKMQGLNRGDLQTKLKYHDQSTLDQSFIQTINGVGEIKDKKPPKAILSTPE